MIDFQKSSRFLYSYRIIHSVYLTLM